MCFIGDEYNKFIKTLSYDHHYCYHYLILFCIKGQDWNESDDLLNIIQSFNPCIKHKNIFFKKKNLIHKTINLIQNKLNLISNLLYDSNELIDNKL